MQRLEVSGAIRPIYGSLGVKRLMCRDGMKIFCVGGQKFLVQFKSENCFKCSSVLHTKLKNFNLFFYLQNAIQVVLLVQNMYHKRENAGTPKPISGMQTILFLKPFYMEQITTHITMFSSITPDLILDIL